MQYPETTITARRVRYVNIALFGQNDLIDHVEAAIDISVQEGDYFGTGRIPNRESGIFLVEHEWSYQ